MENDILEILEDVCYSGPILQPGHLDLALKGGPKSKEFTDLVAWISQELKRFCKLDEHVNPIDTPDHSSAFLLELSSFLKELCCPYEELTGGHVNDRLQTRSSCATLLSFLLSELQAGRMIEAAKPDPSEALKVKLHESSTASDLKTMLMALRFPKPPDNIAPGMLFGKVESKLKEVIVRAPPELVGKPLFQGHLSDAQWQQLQNLQLDFQREYLMRRQMLLKRLDVTIQSFQWSDRVKTLQEHIQQIYNKYKNSLAEEPNVGLADMLAAREDLAILEKTSCSSVRKNTQSDVNKVLIGKVPDRGGRPEDQRAPPPEMPSWQQRQPGQQGGGGGWRGGNRGGGRGDGKSGGGRGGRGGGGWSNKGDNRVQGGWSQRGGNNDRGDFRSDSNYQYQESGGGYQQGGGSGGHQGGNYRGGGGGRGGQNRGSKRARGPY